MSEHSLASHAYPFVQRHAIGLSGGLGTKVTTVPNVLAELHKREAGGWWLPVAINYILDVEPDDGCLVDLQAPEEYAYGVTLLNALTGELELVRSLWRSGLPTRGQVKTVSSVLIPWCAERAIQWWAPDPAPANW